MRLGKKHPMNAIRTLETDIMSYGINDKDHDPMASLLVCTRLKS